MSQCFIGSKMLKQVQAVWVLPHSHFGCDLKQLFTLRVVGYNLFLRSVSPTHTSTPKSAIKLVIIPSPNDPYDASSRNGILRACPSFTLPFHLIDDFACTSQLCVSTEADETELKKAYRRQAMKVGSCRVTLPEFLFLTLPSLLKYHPDKNPSADAEEKFKEIRYAQLTSKTFAGFLPCLRTDRPQ